MNSTSPLRPTHLILHHRPEEVGEESRITVEGCGLSTVTLLSHQQSEPFPISFEVATERLAELPRMFVEPDGSFVWVSEPGAVSGWQVDGVVNDRAAHVVSVELKGSCPQPSFEQLLSLFDWPASPLLIQLVQAAVFIEVSEYFRFADPG